MKSFVYFIVGSVLAVWIISMVVGAFSIDKSHVPLKFNKKYTLTCEKISGELVGFVGFIEWRCENMEAICYDSGVVILLFPLYYNRTCFKK